MKEKWNMTSVLVLKWEGYGAGMHREWGSNIFLSISSVVLIFGILIFLMLKKRTMEKNPKMNISRN
jgi:hypothetical protein